MPMTLGAARIRQATAGDALSCARLLLMASHGLAEARGRSG